MSETKTISLAGSDGLYWEDVDKHAKKQGYTTTSSYIQYLLEKDILGIKAKVKDKITYIILFLILAMMTLTTILILR